MIELTPLISTGILVMGNVLIAIISGYSLVKVAQLKHHINSRMDQLLKTTSESEFAKGKIQGKIDNQNESATK